MVNKKISWVSVGKQIDKFLKKDSTIEKEMEWIEKFVSKNDVLRSKFERLFNTKKKEKEEKIKQKEEEKRKKQEEKEKAEQQKIKQKEAEEFQKIQLKHLEIEKQKQMKEGLKREKALQDIENLEEDSINWKEDDYFESWDSCKGYCKYLWDHKKEYSGEPPKWFLVAHSKDKIVGRPQLIDNVQTKIPLVRLAVNKVKCKKEEDLSGFKEIQSFFFFDEKFDKRHDGFQQDTFGKFFWIYQIISDDGKKYFILSEKKLPNETCSFSGMKVEMGDFAEMSRSLRLPAISSFYFVKDFEPSVKVLSKEEIVEFTKSKEINEVDWLNCLAYHPLGTMNNFPLEVEMLKSSYVLSGKVDGWPMHLGIMGPAGTKKTMGHVETLGYKFSEIPKIAEGSTWRIKGLIPSYKGTIADVGFLIRSERVGLVDEIGKMIENELKRHDVQANNQLGDFNFIMEHKLREGGSGNTGQVSMQATAKYMIITNPVSKRNTISSHVGLIDATFMSRVFWWVQDDDEIEFVLGKNGVLRGSCESVGGNIENPPKTSTRALNNFSILKKEKKFSEAKFFLIENRKEHILLGKSWGKIENRDNYLTIFDTCYNFVSKIDDLKVKSIADTITALAKEPMKSSVWKPRSYHHVKLLIDGLCKHRCLFEDYDSSFEANQEDYDMAERILIRMVKGWETSLQPKEEL